MVLDKRVSIGLSTFVDYVVAPASKKIHTVQQSIEVYSSPFRPFYVDWTEALLAGVADRSEPLRLRRLLSEQSQPARIKNYGDLNDGWSRVRRNDWNIQPATASPRLWSSGRLDIKVRPDLLIETSDRVFAAKLYLKAPAITTDAVTAAVRLMQLTFPDDGVEFVVLDVRRAVVTRPRANRNMRNFDKWLASESASFNALWEAFSEIA